MYAQFIAINANFRFKLKNRGVNDPELGFRRSYFVENLAYPSRQRKYTRRGGTLYFAKWESVF